VRLLVERLQPLASSINSVVPSRGVEDMGEYKVLRLCKPTLNPKASFRRCPSVIVQTPGPKSVFLFSGIGMELVITEGYLELVAGHVVCVSTDTTKADCEIVWSEPSKSAPLGSAQQEQVINEMLSGLNANLRAALERFTVKLQQVKAAGF
jgi:hypothetical protein